MQLHFNIQYRAPLGQELVLNLMDGEGLTPCRMHSQDGEHWWHNMVARPQGEAIEYFYTVEEQGQELRREWTTIPHRLHLTAALARAYNIYNRWNELPEDSYRYSSAFTDCIKVSPTAPLPPTAHSRTVRITVRAPQLRQGHSLALVGEDPALGAWDPAAALPMTQINNNEWAVDVDADALAGPSIEFKFVVAGAAKPLWEHGPNRTLEIAPMGEGELTAYDLEQAFFGLCDERFAGTLVPVFSLRSRGSFGVGDFGDLALMAQFCASTRQRVLQILPVNDTTKTGQWTDSYPYSCISIFALHPIYADLRQLPPLRDEGLRERYRRLGDELNALPQIDYERVYAAKTEILAQLYADHGREELKEPAFKAWFAQNQQWLVPYAQFCTLRDQYGTACFGQWPDHREWNEEDRQALTNARTAAYRRVAPHYWVQYVLARQLAAAHSQARQLGVVLKGDIPIGVDRYGCDVWAEPRYFNLGGQAGAPPDDFSADGQNWGFPTYNWDAMLADGCQWWVRRFQNMANYFDAYRIDHVLGFFRIWEIPIDSVHGLTGQFSPSLGLTPQEIEAYGLPWHPQLYTRPFIADWTLQEMFGDQADDIKAKYLTLLYSDIYALRPEVDTQRKIEALGLDAATRDRLYSMASDVLFVPDRKEPGKYHPRISAHGSYSFRTLAEPDKQAFCRLYDDYYYRRNNQFWYGEAMKKLPRLVDATRMLVCAEDLGMVPACVDWVMRELRILSLEVQSMPKDPAVRFGQLQDYPYRSVCCLGSHDMPTLRQWWDEDEARTQDYYTEVMGHTGAAPHPLPGWLAREVVSHQLLSASMLCVLSLQDYLAIDEALRLPDQNAERINIPANPRHYWRYRMHLPIEDLLANDSFRQNLIGLMTMANRT